MSNRADYHLPPTEGFVVTHFLTVADVNRSAEFYVRIFGGTVVRSGEPTIIQLANSWLIVNVGGGPTDDKPTVTLRPPVNPTEVSSFLTKLQRSAATCVILTATSSRLGKPPPTKSEPEWEHAPLQAFTLAMRATCERWYKQFF